MSFVFPPPPPVSLPVLGTDARFPIRRIFCVGRNYADHAREMGAIDQASGLEPPFFFMKPADTIVTGGGELLVNYPPQTADLQHEVELVVALAAGGASIPAARALDCVFGHTVGLDLTRRDMQAKAKAKGHPWDLSKGFDQAAVAGVVRPAADYGHPVRGRIWLKVNGELRQDGDLVQMGWKVADIIANLSASVCLAAGDLIYTGTPAGVGTIGAGDELTAGVDGVGEIRVRITR